MIQHWPIENREKTVLSHIAAQMWIQKQYTSSPDAMVHEIIPAKVWNKKIRTVTIGRKRYRIGNVERLEQNVYHGIFLLEEHGLLKRTPISKRYEAMSDAKQRQYWISGRHDFEILNKPLAVLVARRSKTRR